MEPETYSERLKKNRADKRKRALKRLVAVCILPLALWGGYYLLSQPWFSFGVIYITGTEKIKREEILFLTGLKEPVNLFLARRDSVKTLLMNDLRIKNAVVGYELPNVFHIDLEEKEPFLYIASNYGYAVLDSGGTVISAAKSVKDAAAPIASGLKAGNEFVGDRIEDDEILQILSFLDLLDRQTRSVISEINIGADGKVKLFDLPGRWYLLGEIGQLRQKAKTFVAINKEVFEKNLSVEFVDLSYSKPYIKIKRREMKEKG